MVREGTLCNTPIIIIVNGNFSKAPALTPGKMTFPTVLFLLKTKREQEDVG